MNPIEQACAEVEDARARHDTQKQHRATKKADVSHASTARAGNLFSRTFARIWGWL